MPVSLAGAATGASGWDTDARAVPGPSNHLLFKTSTASSAPARPTPAAPESRSAPPPASSSQTEGDFVNVVMPDGGKSRGPVIVPTVLDPDGVKVVPASFELCEVEDLIILIGECSPSHCPAHAHLPGHDRAGRLARIESSADSRRQRRCSTV